MGKGSEQADFEREFRGQIERFAPSVVAALRAIITAKRPPAVKILSFEIQADWRKFPVYAFALDDKAQNESCFEPPFKGALLPDVGALIPKDAINQAAYQKAGVA